MFGGSFCQVLLGVPARIPFSQAAQYWRSTDKCAHAGKNQFDFEVIYMVKKSLSWMLIFTLLMTFFPSKSIASNPGWYSEFRGLLFSIYRIIRQYNESIPLFFPKEILPWSASPLRAVCTSPEKVVLRLVHMSRYVYHG